MLCILFSYIYFSSNFSACNTFPGITLLKQAKIYSKFGSGDCSFIYFYARAEGTEAKASKKPVSEEPKKSSFLGQGTARSDKAARAITEKPFDSEEEVAPAAMPEKAKKQKTERPSNRFGLLHSSDSDESEQECGKAVPGLENRQDKAEDNKTARAPSNGQKYAFGGKRPAEEGQRLADFLSKAPLQDSRSRFS